MSARTHRHGASRKRPIHPHPFKPRHHRLCWVRQEHVEKRSGIRRLKAREIEYAPLVKLTLMAWEICYRDLTNRVYVGPV
jgi:hypothetical protein